MANFFQKQPDINIEDRTALIKYLKSHNRYYTMNSWNRSTSYSNNVKIYNLGLNEEIQDKALALLCADTDELDIEEYHLKQKELIQNFREETNYDVVFNGRSAGYLVLLDTKYDMETNTLMVYPGKSIDADADFEEWDDDDLYYRYTVVNKFDKLCDDLRDLLIDYATNGTIEETTYFVPTTIRKLTIKEK